MNGYGDELRKALFGDTPQSPSLPTNPANLFRPIPPQPLLKVLKRKVFVSYHHKDQVAVNTFRALGGAYEIFSDASLDRLIDSNDTSYVSRTIREDYITGTSITIVLCGIDTWKRKYVDWEIHSTLSKGHALLGIMLPGILGPIQSDGQRRWLIPDRLHTNITGSYAHFISYPQNTHELSTAINEAITRSTQFKHLKDNSANKMFRNLS
jgi:hypothetical protein